ncbi:TPA: hypothetical protein ACH3X2_010885 [Trebouxia sp. C0005]
MGKPLSRSWQSTPSQFCRSLRAKQLTETASWTHRTYATLNLKLAQLTWKLHDNEAQSVWLFYQQHSEFAFIYQEQRHSQPQQSVSQSASGQAGSHPAGSQAVIQPASSQAVTQAVTVTAANTQSERTHVSQKLIFGWMTAAMCASLLKYGKNNIVLVDATKENASIHWPCHGRLWQWPARFHGLVSRCQ